MGLLASPAPGPPLPPTPILLFPRPGLVPNRGRSGPGSPADSLRGPDVAVQVQPHGSHGKVLQTAPPARKLPLHLPSPGPITGVLRGAVGGSPPQAQIAYLIVQAQEAQGIADTLHLVQDVGAQHHGCEGDVDGAAASRRDHLADSSLSAGDTYPRPQPWSGGCSLKLPAPPHSPPAWG